MGESIRVVLLGEPRIFVDDVEAVLPPSKKARALLSFLVATGRPHRRERLCELFWDMPDDPKAALRWALTKLRKVVDRPDCSRIIADRERVQFDLRDVEVDLRTIHSALRSDAGNIGIDQLAEMAHALSLVPFDGMDGAGDDSFDAWLTAEREDANAARAEILKRLALHPEASALAAQKWLRLWAEVDPEGAEASRQSASQTPPTGADIVEGEADLPRNQALRRISARGHALRTQNIGFCEVRDGTKIAYATVGTGPPLLKAANWLNHLEFDWSSPIWGRAFAAIARGRTFVRYDERGCGLSDWDVTDLSFEAFVEDLEAVADKLGLQRFPLLGISQGAAVSIEYAVRHPERVSGLILVSGYAAGWRHTASPEEQARREAVLTLTELGWGTDNPAYRHIFSKTFMPEASPADLEWFDEFQRQTTSPQNAARFQDAFGYIDVRHRLAEVTAPTIVLHAKYDQRIPLELGRALAAGIPDAHFVPLESRNHILVDKEPAWATALETANRFLAEKGI